MKSYILKPLVYLLFFIIITIILLPKENLYFYTEQQLEKHNIIISNEKISSKSFGIQLRNGKIYYNSIYFGSIKNIDISFFIINNIINIDTLLIEDSFKNFFPAKIDNIVISYELFDPLNINLYAIGEFGEVKGFYSLIENKISFELSASTKMKQDHRPILAQLKLNKGKYSYEYRF